MKDVEKEFEELEEGLEKKEIKIPVKQMMTLGPKLVKLLNSFILQWTNQPNKRELLKATKSFSNGKMS